MVGAEEAEEAKVKRPTKAAAKSEAELLPEPAGLEGVTQRRGHGHAEQGRYRLTYEARQAVLNYFSTEDPKGVVIKGLLVVPGQHCRLSNISPEGKWIKSESFSFGGVSVKREAGKSAGRLMLNWRRLRDKAPELFEQVSVMSQPSAFVDSIIMQWSIEELEAEVGANVSQRGLLTSGLSTTVRSAMSLAHSIPCWIGGKMTAVLQLTDTDFSFSFKASIAQAKHELRQQLRAKAAAQKCKLSFKCGCFELLKICVEAQKAQVVRNEKDQWILKGLRRNGMLSWRPDMKAGRLVRSSSQPWCQDMPEGSHRIPEKWMKMRYTWVDENGVPEKADWTLSRLAHEEADMEEAEYHGPLGNMRRLTAVGPVLPEHHAELELAEDEVDEVELGLTPRVRLLQLHPKERKSQLELMELLTDQAPKELQEERRKEKLQVKKLSRVMLRTWSGKMQQQMQAEGKTRMELLSEQTAVAKAPQKTVKKKAPCLSCTLLGFAFLWVLPLCVCRC